MQEVQFNEEETQVLRPRSQIIQESGQKKGMPAFLQKIGLAKTEERANIILVGICIIFILAAIFLTFIYPRLSRPTLKKTTPSHAQS